jgi:hypothetical protein
MSDIEAARSDIDGFKLLLELWQDAVITSPTDSRLVLVAELMRLVKAAETALNVPTPESLGRYLLQREMARTALADVRSDMILAQAMLNAAKGDGN